jgi:peptide deformylase
MDNQTATTEPSTNTPISPAPEYADRIFVEPEGIKGRKRAIVLFPDDRLGQASATVQLGDDKTRLQQLAADLVATATAANAAGLSAVQVGEPVRVMAIRVSEEPQFVVLVNPELDLDLGEYVTVEEGCLSFPGVKEKVDRAKDLTVYYRDLDGAQQGMTLSIGDSHGAAAQAVQHEHEHLDGVTMLASLNLVHRDRIRNHMKKVHRKLAAIRKQTGGKLPNEAVLFGYVPDAP